MLYHALGNFEINGSRKGNLIFGLPVGGVKNYNTLKRNAKVYEDKMKEAIGTPDEFRDADTRLAVLDNFEVAGQSLPADVLVSPELKKQHGNLIKNFLYYKFVALDPTYQKNHVVGLKFDPFGPGLRDMDRETREFMFSKEDTARRQRVRDEKFNMPSVLATTSVPDVQTLDSRQGQAMREVKKIGSPDVVLDSAMTKAQQNRILMFG